MRAFWVVVACLLFAGLCRGGEPPRLFASRVGVNVKFSQGESQQDLALLKDLGVRWVRDNAPWPEMEPTPGRFVDFPKPFADRLAFYKANNIGVVLGLWYENSKAYPITPEHPFDAWNPDAYGRYAAHVARLMQASGVKFVLEIWNEPHNTMKNFGGKWNAEPPSPWVDQYVKMVVAATKAVKAVDPSIRLLSDDDMWVLHYRFIEKGLPTDLDGFAVHPYVTSWPEFSATEPDTSWTKPFVTVDADRSLKSAVRRLRDAGSHGRTPAIWITEWGWPLGGVIHDRPMTEELLAGLIPRAYLTAADAGVEAVLWFSIQDNVDGPMGLTSNDGKKRLTYTALKTMVQQLGKTTTIEHLEGESHPTSGVQVYKLSGEGIDTVWAVWNIDGDAGVCIQGTHPKPAMLDALGRPAVFSELTEKGVWLTAGRSCKYLTGLDPKSSIVPLRAEGLAPAYLFP